MTRFTRAAGAILVAAMLAACSGGGSNGVVPGSSTTTPQKQKLGYIRATLHIPGKAKHQSARTIAFLEAQQARHRHSHRSRGPKFLSGATTELDFVINSISGTAATAADRTAYDFTIYTDDLSECSGNSVAGFSCTVTAAAPVGSDTYQIYAQQCSVSGSSPTQSCASLGGTLTQLSASYTSVTVIYDTTVTAAFTLSPVVASIDWAPVTYATEAGPTELPNNLWLVRPNGSNIPSYAPNPAPGTYGCTFNVGTGSGNGCYEPVAQGVQIAYGDVLEARDASGALIVGASDGGTVYQTPLYLDAAGNAITISWTCHDQVAGGSSLAFETGNGPYASNGNAQLANQAFNSPVSNPASDPDGGNTVDANGNPVTAIGNNGVEFNWDGVDSPKPNAPDSCSASTSDGLSTALNFYAGLGEGGITTPVGPNASIYALDFNHGNQNLNGGLTGMVAYFAGGRLAPPPDASFLLPGFSSLTVPSQAAGSLTLDSNGNLWVAASGGDNVPSVTAVVEYAANPSSNPIPLTSINIPNPQLQQARSIAVDPSGEIYVAIATTDPNTGAQISDINVYAPGASGDASPIRTIVVSGVGAITKMVFDAGGNLWAGAVYDSAPGYVLAEFPPNASGNVTPTTISLDSQPGCQGGWNAGFVFDAAGNLVVACQTSILTFPPGFNGSTPPQNEIDYTDSGLLTNGGFNDVAEDANGYIYVSAATLGSTRSSLDDHIFVFSPGSSGSVLPLADIHGAGSLLNYNNSIAVWPPAASLSGNARHRAAASRGKHR